jgi:hypothetical protein
MATGRIRRSAGRGIAAAVLGWLGIVGATVALAPSAGAAPSATIEIRNVTPPAASVDPGGRVTFVNRIPAENRGGISVPLVGSVSATVFTDVSVTFFGQRRDLQPEQSAAWNFSAPGTSGEIAYTYRIVPQAGLTASVAGQVVDTVAGQLPPLPAPIPYVVQTVAPALPSLPGVNIPQLPTVTVPPLPGGPGTPPQPPLPQGPGGQPQGGQPPGGGGPTLAGASGPAYTYGSGAGVPRMTPSDIAAAAAFDPNRFYVPGRSPGGVDRAGSGGMAGSYDGASVPVFGQLAGLDGSSLDESAIAEEAAASSPAPQTLPAAALAAVVALAAVTAALVRTHQASRPSR